MHVPRAAQLLPVLGLCGVLGVPVAAQRVAIPVRSYAAAREFNARVTLDPGSSRIGEVLADLATAAAVPFAAIPDEAPSTYRPPETGIACVPVVRYLPVVAGANHVPAHALMHALEYATNSAWHRTGNRWVLTNETGLERLATMTGWQLQTDSGLPIVALHRLSPAQAQTLASTGTLTWKELTAVQRRACEAFSTRALTHYGKVYDPTSLIIRGPASFLTEGLIVYRHEDNGDWDNLGQVSPAGISVDPRVGTPDEPEPPGMQPRGAEIVLPERGLEEARRWDSDARLEGVLPPASGAKPTVLDAAAAVAKFGKIDLVVSTRLGARPLFQLEPRSTFRRAMEAIREATGGTWRYIDGIYALQPRKAVEALQPTGSNLSYRWKLEAVAEVIKSLDGPQRDTLLQEGKLPVARLTQAQRTKLERVTTLVFASTAGYAPETLDLKGVELTHQKPPPGFGGLGSMLVRMQTLGGEKREAAYGILR